MSLDAWGDEGDVNSPEYDAGYEAGREAGWDEALEHIAAMLEGGIHASQDDDHPSAKATAMTIRAMAGRYAEFH